MKTSFLDFEQPMADLEGKIESLRFEQDDSVVDISEEIARLVSFLCSENNTYITGLLMVIDGGFTCQ